VFDMVLFKNFLTNFLLCLSFISRIPVRLKDLNDWEESIKRSTVYFPAVGYIPGMIYSFGVFLLQRAPNLRLLILPIFLAIGYYLFDLFHFDGLLDTLDGFLNQSGKERRLEIMAKGNVGPFAIFYGTLYVVLLYQLMNELYWKDFLFAAVFGRYGMNTLLTFSVPAKPNGLGAMLFPYNKLFTFYATIFTLPLALLDLQAYIISFSLTWFTGYIFTKVSELKIGGVTGDVIGASCLITQMVVLLVFYGLKFTRS